MGRGECSRKRGAAGEQEAGEEEEGEQEDGGRRKEGRKGGRKDGGALEERERQKRAGVPRVRWLDACLILANIRI